MPVFAWSAAESASLHLSPISSCGSLASSSMTQLQNWVRTTNKLQHVSNIHMVLTGRVPRKVLGLAMQLLNRHFNNISELHLLAISNGNSSSKDTSTIPAAPATASIYSLLPLQHNFDRLKILVLQGVAVADLPDDLQQLGAAAVSAGEGWQLRSLKLLGTWTKLKEYCYSYGVLCAESCSSKMFSNAMTRLTSIFSSLQ